MDLAVEDLILALRRAPVSLQDALGGWNGKTSLLVFCGAWWYANLGTDDQQASHRDDAAGNPDCGRLHCWRRVRCRPDDQQVFTVDDGCLLTDIDRACGRRRQDARL